NTYTWSYICRVDFWFTFRPVCSPSVHPYFSSTPPSPTALSPLSLHDALPICALSRRARDPDGGAGAVRRLCAGRSVPLAEPGSRDRNSTRLNSSHVSISYAVFCLKKKTIQQARFVR